MHASRFLANVARGERQGEDDRIIKEAEAKKRERRTEGESWKNKGKNIEEGRMGRDDKTTGTRGM